MAAKLKPRAGELVEIQSKSLTGGLIIECFWSLQQGGQPNNQPQLSIPRGQRSGARPTRDQGQTVG